MHCLLFLAVAFIGTVTSLSLQRNPLVSPSDQSWAEASLVRARNSSLHAPNTIKTSNTTSNGWPPPPFRSKIVEEVHEGITETTYLIIDRYLFPNPDFFKGIVLGNISKLEELIESYKNPDFFIDNQRVFSSGPVKARFPATQENNGKRITNGLARELLSAAWGFEYAYGPRGWSFGTVLLVSSQGTKDVIGYFSLWIEGITKDQHYTHGT